MKPARTIEVETGSLEETRQKIKARLSADELIIAERILSDGEFRLITASADTVDEAFELAEKQVPIGAAILEKTEKTSPGRKLVGLEASDENAARVKMTAQFTGPVSIKSVRLAAAGQKGFLGLGAKPNKYEADVLQQAVVELGYKTKARISCDILKRDDIKRALNSDGVVDRFDAALILLNSSDRADRLEAANALQDQKSGLLPLFNAIWNKDNDEVHAISVIFWHSLWYVANANTDKLPPMQRDLAKIEDPRAQLSFFSSSMVKMLEGVPSMAGAKQAFLSDIDTQVRGLRPLVEGLVKDFVLDGQALGAGHIERVGMIMDQIYKPKTSTQPDLCKAYKSGRCVIGRRDSGPCTWNNWKWETCNVVIENKKLGSW